ncbi:EGF domain-containing protein [Myxococcus fulvus 124B02]|nr:EGF domain-containing protein [Myxococcus fulvus 124B02]
MVSDEGVEALTEAAPEASLAWDPYADAVGPGTSSTVLFPNNALGAPDRRAATVLGLLNTALVLDLGQGEEGTGDLRVHYQGLTVGLVTQVDFLKADRQVVGSGTLRLVEVGVGTHVAVVRYTGSLPYRYVRLRAVLLAIYQVDAVETSVRPFCGDGLIGGSEDCDDGNQLSGDGCDSVCEVESGYTCSGEPSVCVDIDECALGTDTCAPDEVCVNTPGGFECEAPACSPPRIICAEACVDPRTDNNHCGGCGNVCGQGTACTEGVCLGTGNLQFTATWSRNGDADLYVKTPNNKLIFFGNRGPSEQTDFGALDVDDTAGDGPENIFWAQDRTPPSGTYEVCLRVGGFNPPPSPAQPVSYSIRVRRPGQQDLAFSGVATQPVIISNCVAGQPGHVASVVYP